MQALSDDRATIEISKAEAASLPSAFVATLKARKAGFVVPVDLRTFEQFMKNEASSAARKSATCTPSFGTDSASGAPIGRFFLDLSPRPGKYLRPANFPLRAGRRLPDGSYQQPISSIIGNGPASEPGKPALFSHRDLIEFFHEFGHLMHTTLSTAPHASLYGANVRGDFAEAPSQMLENWMWQPSILKKVSSHVTSGQPLPDALIEKLLARKHSTDGIFWTRQAFLGVFDLTIHSSGTQVDSTRLWFSLMPQLTLLPPPPAGTLPDASFLPIMGGYDAGYYGYVWSRVYAQDMFTAFQKGGLDNPEVGLRYRREILEPGGTAEPEDLLSNFLGRSVRSDAFYEELGIDM